MTRVICEEHELLFLDTWLREIFTSSELGVREV